MARATKPKALKAPTRDQAEVALAVMQALGAGTIRPSVTGSPTSMLITEACETLRQYLQMR